MAANDTLEDKMRYQELKNKLKNAGCNADISYAGTKGFIFPEEYDHIILEYLGTFEREGLNSHILHCIVKSKKYSLIPVLLEQFHNTLQDNTYRWTLGDGLYIIGYKDEFFYDYMEIAGNAEYGISRQMVVWLLGRSKRQEAFELLISLMNNWDYDVMMHTLSALNLIKSERVYDEVKHFAEEIISEKGKERFKSEMYARVSKHWKDDTEAQKRRTVQGIYTEYIRHINKILVRHGNEIPKEYRKLYVKK